MCESVQRLQLICCVNMFHGIIASICCLSMYHICLPCDLLNIKYVYTSMATLCAHAHAKTYKFQELDGSHNPLPYHWNGSADCARDFPMRIYLLETRAIFELFFNTHQTCVENPRERFVPCGCMSKPHMIVGYEHVHTVKCQHGLHVVLGKSLDIINHVSHVMLCIFYNA